MSVRKELIAAQDLRIGMFVVELDRPWEGTPFLLQGFVVEDERELAQLRSLCRFVYIDRTRSLADHYRADDTTDVAAQVGRGARPSIRPTDEGDATAGQAGFIEVLDLVRKGQLDSASARRLALPAANDEPCPVERELVRAALTFEHAASAFADVVSDVEGSRAPDLGGVVGSVDEMMHSIHRNPDALLWLLRLRRYDTASYHHALEVSVYMMLFARSLGFAEEGVSLLGVVGLMQDIGKISVPQRVLLKQGPLTRLEMEIAKAHVEFSKRIIAVSTNGLPGIVDVVERHHERIDGTGYPRGLRGEEVGLHGEMAGIVDTFCTMTRERSYGEPLSSQRALEALVKLRDLKFSAAVVDAFIQCVGLYPAGTLVELNSGEVGVVISQNRVRRLQPRVLVLLGPDKTPNRYPPTLDLLYAPSMPSGERYAITRSLPPGAYGVDPAEFYLS